MILAAIPQKKQEVHDLHIKNNYKMQQDISLFTLLSSDIFKLLYLVCKQYSW